MNEEKILNLKRGGIFESLCAYGGKIFRLDEHITRLFASAKTLGIDVPQSRKELKLLLRSSLKKSGRRDAYLRLTLPRREGELDIIVKKLPSYAQKCYDKGLKIKTAPTRKPSANTLVPLSKSSDFLGGVFAKIEASPAAEEGLLLSEEGYVSEASVSNIFLIKNETLISPPAYLGMLSGITRQAVIELAQELKIKFREEPITRHALYNASEVFLTNTSMGIMPVREVDGRRVGSPGKITRRLRGEFNKLLHRRRPLA